MTAGEPGPLFRPRSTPATGRPSAHAGQVLETVVSPFHCLYQDALWFHTQSHLRLARSESEASRLARAALLLYLDAAASLVHQAAAELGRHELGRLIGDPERPLPLAEAWRLLPALCEQGEVGFFDPESAPWPQFEELLALRVSWNYPGATSARCAYYRASTEGGAFEPMQPHQVPPGLGIDPRTLLLERTGLPRDPYALRPSHLDTARGVLDGAIAALDRRMGGALTRDSRHRKEPVRLLDPAEHLPLPASSGP